MVSISNQIIKKVNISWYWFKIWIFFSTNFFNNTYWSLLHSWPNMIVNQCDCLKSISSLKFLSFFNIYCQSRMKITKNKSLDWSYICIYIFLKNWMVLFWKFSPSKYSSKKLPTQSVRTVGKCDFNLRLILYVIRMILIKTY